MVLLAYQVSFGLQIRTSDLRFLTLEAPNFVGRDPFLTNLAPLKSPDSQLSIATNITKKTNYCQQSYRALK